MTMNNANDTQGYEDLVGKHEGLRSLRRPIIINRINVIADGKHPGRMRQDNRNFRSGLKRFHTGQLTPEERRSLLERREKHLQKRLAYIQEQLKTTQ